MSCTLWQLMDCLLIMVCIKLMRFICVHKVICIPLAIFGFNEIHLCLMIFMVGGVPVSSRTLKDSVDDSKILKNSVDDFKFPRDSVEYFKILDLRFEDFLLILRFLAGYDSRILY